MRFLMMAAYDLSPVYILMSIFPLSNIKKIYRVVFRVLPIPLYPHTPALTEFNSQHENTLFFCFVRTIKANLNTIITEKVLNNIDII